ncbi:TPA: Fe-S cluster protein [Candidatus Peribacteria bacterium]|nr:MAG: hypothetical protein A2529_02805 [Candidatus Peribacteria bacterium RIFOXYD2_FULL_58_15]HAI98185.1 Fe-S cluster protein [Candidatus Peribacteria bacterium]HAS34534.1 Fe-S cluster protein [Candidatus Peribacteria bacterium]
MDLYAESILDHAHHPLCKGPMKHPTVSHEETNASCGDSLELRLLIKGKRINDIRWEGEGCAISQAAMSMFAGHLKGMTTEEAAHLPPRSVFDLLKVSIGPRRTKCALLCLHALKNALRKLNGEPAQSWTETIGN